MIQSADSVMGSINERITRVRELTVSLGNGSMQDDEKAIIQNEVNSLLEGIDYEVKNFSFNGLNILGDENVKDNAQHGVVDVLSTGNAGEFTEVPKYNLSTESLGIGGLDINNEDISSVLEKLDNAASQVIDARTKLGAINNTLEDKINQSQSLEDVLVGSKSKVEDADIALEMVEFSKTLILTEANIKNK